ncbi:MAG: peptidoglycan editing factor PgeF [Clostridia bacterium]|nr:peptidoglycan editing factor PgeF [Clostridia bacterium]
MNKSFYKTENKGVTLVKSGLLEAEQSVRHCFTTRLGGVSTGFYASMNMGFGRGEDRDIVLRNYELVCEAAGLNFSRLTRTYQRHGINVKEVTDENVGSGFFIPEFDATDALITKLEYTPIVVHIADCVPVLLYDRSKRACAAVHAGWRGMAAGVIEAAINAMEDAYGTDASDLVAAVGPCVGPCCFEVDEDVADVFRSDFGMSVIIPADDEHKTRVDLPKCAVEALTGRGVPESNIDVSGDCTVCDETHYYSHRRMGENRGSQIAVIQISGR